MSDVENSPIEICEACAAEVNLADFEPLTSVDCPACGKPMVVSKTLGPYELIEAMGRGGMGVVYRANDQQLDRQVALKVLRSDLSDDVEFIRKLEEEAAITGGINHPHVVKVYTTGYVRGRFYIAMELVDQGTLDDLMEMQGRIAEVQALEIGSQIAQGLRAANQLGLIHRDVKPGNILFSGPHSSKIVDFGLAILQEASTGEDEIWGTPYYVSPERLDHKPEDFRSDMYSLGATIFHAIAGRPPFEAEDATRVALKHLKSQAVSLQAFAPWVAGSTAFVINRMLHKDPNGRYESYDELIEHLEYARVQLQNKGSGPIRKERVVLETAADRKLWGQVTIGVFALLLLAGIGAGLYFAFWAPPLDKEGTAVTSSIGADRKHAAQFEAARQLIVQNKSKAGADAFKALADEKNLPQPFLQWCLLQQAIGDLLAGDLPRSLEVLDRLQKSHYAADDPSGRVQSEFFDHVAKLMLEPTIPKSPDLEEYNRTAYGALAQLLFGLKCFEKGEFEIANSTLRGFQNSTPKGAFSWIAQYQPLVEDRLTDLSSYRREITAYKAAKTAPALRKAAASMQKVKAAMGKNSTALAKKLDAAIADANKQAEQKEKAKPAASPKPAATPHV